MAKKNNDFFVEKKKEHKHGIYADRGYFYRFELEAFGFCTSKQIVPTSKMRNICSQTKNKSVTCIC